MQSPRSYYFMVLLLYPKIICRLLSSLIFFCFHRFRLQLRVQAVVSIASEWIFGAFIFPVLILSKYITFLIQYMILSSRSSVSQALMKSSETSFFLSLNLYLDLERLSYSVWITYSQQSNIASTSPPMATFDLCYYFQMKLWKRLSWESLMRIFYWFNIILLTFCGVYEK